MVRAMCGAHFKDRIGSIDLILALSETIDQLAMASSVCWYGHVLRREDGHVLRRKVLYFNDEGRRKKGRPKRTWKKQVEEKV